MVKEFFRLEAAGGILLCVAAILALIMKNSPMNTLYDALLTTPVVIQVGVLALNKPLLLWVNDGLMAIFFLLIGLEIKREILEGQFSNREQIILPVIAATGGLLVPAAIYVAFNWGNSTNLHGWAIPAATDIAFVLGVMSLLGSRVPETLKLCLVAIAIIDDLAAIIIIALFYTESFSTLSFVFIIAAVLVFVALNRLHVTKLTPYILTGIVLWVCVLKSGVHATLAGVVMGFFIPLKPKLPGALSPLRALEHELHPWVAFGVLPLFAFANAGVSLHGISLATFASPVTLGIAAGLLFGKQIGVMLFSGLGILLRCCTLPRGVSWRQYHGMSVLTGIGFTMSLFIGMLAFSDQAQQTYVRLGVLGGSIASGLLGYVLLRLTKPYTVGDQGA